jgi:hypothetical protein
MALWVYSDIIETIKQMNSGSTSVSDSPVKRLLSVSFTEPVLISPGGSSDSRRRSSRGDTDSFSYIIEEEEPPMGTVPWTGRNCNDFMDVIHFSFSVIVSSDQVMPFIDELCKGKEHSFRKGYSPDGELVTGLTHNQITVLDYDHLAESKDEGDRGNYYRYGKDAVLRVSFVCEYVFVREGYDAIKPDSIKELLGVDESSGGEEGGRGRGAPGEPPFDGGAFGPPPM